MEIIWASFLGIIQGLTEFFPVSSSGHLTALPWIINFRDPGLAFDIALHAGTLVAIILALKTDWITLTKSLFDKKAQSEHKLIGYLAITTIPAFLAGYFLETKAETIFRSPLLVAATLSVFGAILWAVDTYLGQKDEIDKMDPKKALLVGLAQACAIIPGVSRSGATVTAARALGFSREASVRYSFLAALPVIAGATVFGLKDVPLAELTSSAWLFGFAASLIVSFWAIKFLTKYVTKHNFNIFVFWRFGLSALIILIYLAR